MCSVHHLDTGRMVVLVGEGGERKGEWGGGGGGVKMKP